MKQTKYIFILLLTILSITSCKDSKQKQTDEGSKTSIENVSFLEKIKNIFPDAEITLLENSDHFSEVYQMILKQPLDHNNPAAGTFDHYVYLSHSDYNKPTVLVTEGYQAKQKTYELSKLLKSNQVIVEYRFYGKSRPEPMPWQYLRNDQAIEDYHQLVTKLKSIYTKKWLSTGISKGGETVLIYKSKYPTDIDVAVPYVAPLINTQEDIRTEQHINSIGTKECRAKVTKFQRLLLSNRKALLSEISKYSEENKVSFTEVSKEEALEYAALEFPFSFWQWGGKCDEIPGENASPEELFKFMDDLVGIDFYSDKTYHKLLPSYYQHMIELGYYGFDTTPVKDLIKIVLEPTNKRFAPKDVDLTYNPNYIKKVRNYIENKGDNILFINGEYDTWGACAPTPKENVDALKMVLKGGSHKTRIENFSEEDQQKIYNTLQKWLGKDVELFPIETTKPTSK